MCFGWLETSRSSHLWTLPGRKLKEARPAVSVCSDFHPSADSALAFSPRKPNEPGPAVPTISPRPRRLIVWLLVFAPPSPDRIVKKGRASLLSPSRRRKVSRRPSPTRHLVLLPSQSPPVAYCSTPRDHHPFGRRPLPASSCLAASIAHRIPSRQTSRALIPL